MTPVLLPLSTLIIHHACALDERIAAFATYHGVAPGEATTLREWIEVTRAVPDWLWATRYLGRAGRILGLEVATQAARRALAVAGLTHAADARPLRAIEAADAILLAWWEPAGPTEEMMTAASAAASAASAAYAASAAANARAARAAANAAATYAVHDERANQRADFMAALARLEARGDR